MLQTPIFKPWRPVWDAALGSTTRRLDELAIQRQKGRRLLPKVAPEILQLICKDRVQAVLHGTRLPEVRDFLEVMRGIEPLLRACVWPRWLLLEAALDEASMSGALHLSALILRTQIEELDALRIVATVLDSSRRASWDEGALSAARSTLSTRVLPRLRTKTAEELIESARDAAVFGPRPMGLQKVFDELGDYVHPNYGSHVLSVRPHSVEAAGLFVEAFVAVYEEFLDLPWAKELDDQAHEKHETKPQWQSPFLALAEETVRALAPTLSTKADIGPVPWIDAVNCFHRCAEIERDQEESAKSFESGEISGEGPNLDVEAIRALRQHSVPTDARPEHLRTAACRFEYAYLVECERELVEAAERIASGCCKEDDASWLRLLCSGVTFSINVTEFKMRFLMRLAARLINFENVLGATLVIRSLFEHHAVAIELGKKLQALWEKAERVAPTEDKVKVALAEAEKQIARVLAGSSESHEQPSAWKTLWEQTVRKHYNVLNPIRSLNAEKPGFLKTYGLLSHVVHGTVCTGGDLLDTRRGSSKAGQPMLAQLILNLANLSEMKAMLDRQAASMRVGHRLDLLRRDAPRLATRLKEMSILEGQKLKQGRDVLGSGTEGDPFLFRRGLVYHDAYDHYLKQEGITVRNRRLHMFHQRPGDRVEAEDGRVFYFLNDTANQ